MTKYVLSGEEKIMKAMVLGGKALTLEEVAKPNYTDNELLLKVEACGVCRTDLHILDQELDAPKTNLIPGHEIVGRVVALGSKCQGFEVGDLVGVPWLAYTCSNCPYCARGQENLCEQALFTGYTKDGGYSEYTRANWQYCYAIPQNYTAQEAAPLLCAGLIGYRSLAMTGNAKRLGFFGFGAAAHILIQIANFQKRQVFVFTRPGDSEGQNFAKSLKATWTGGSDQMPPEKLDAAIIFAPDGKLIPQALKCLDKGGTVICGGIHMSDIPQFPYSLLWEERSIKSVANLTRKDGHEFFDICRKIKIETTTHAYKLEEANQALSDLRHGKFHGAAVLTF